MAVAAQDLTTKALTVVTSRPSAIANGPRLLRLSWTAFTLLEALPPAGWDEHTRRRLASLWTRLLTELCGVLAPGAAYELRRLMPPIGTDPSESELRVVCTQLVGWLHGLLQGEAFAHLDAAVSAVQGLAEASGRAANEGQ